jgi:capsular exopolysaccharide synthesis family protein
VNSIRPFDQGPGPARHDAEPGYPAVSGAAQPADGIGIQQIFRAMRARWWMLVLGAILTVGIAWQVVPRDRLVYRATAVVLLDDARGTLTGTLTREADNVTSAEFMVTQIQLIHSRTVAGAAVDEVGFRLSPSDELSVQLFRDLAIESGAASDTVWLTFGASSYRARVGGEEIESAYDVPLQLPGLRFTIPSRPAGVDDGHVVILDREAAVDLLTAGIQARQRGAGGRGGSASGFIDITFEDRDPVRARRVVNAIAEAYRAQNFGSVQERSQRRREFIGHLLEQSEDGLREAQQELSTFRTAGTLYSSRDRLMSEQSSLMTLDVRREELFAERRMATSLLQRVESVSELTDGEIRTLVAAPGISSSTLVSQVFGQLVSYQTERERLLAAGRAPSHPDVERVSSLIASMKLAFVDAVRSHIGSLDLRIAALDDMRGRSSATIRSLPAAEAEEATLLQNIEMAQRMTSTLREEYQRARIAEAAEVGQVQIVDLANGAAPQRSGRRVQTLGIALVFGLLFGGGGALLLEVQNSSIRRREDIEDLLHVPGLGVIPRIATARQPQRRWSLPSRRGAVALGASRAGDLVATHMQSVGAEAYRQLRTNLFFSRPAERLKMLVVTSAVSGEGKTTTVANLAVTFARQGMRVLLVDCDLRRPRLHQIFEMEREPGFMDLLLGRATPAEAIRPTGVDGLHLLPRGTFDPEAIERLGAAATKHMLERLAEPFDAVLIDTSPVLVAADAAVLGAMSDGVLLVVRAARTSRDEARQALTQLGTVGARVVGSVLNDPDATTERYGGYYRYYEEYSVVE